MTTFESAREEFKALKNMVYLNWAGTGPLPKSALEAVESMLSDIYEWRGETIQNGMVDIVQNAKSQIAKLMYASPDEIAITGTNTSQGIQTALESIHPEKGESIVTSDMQYVLTEAEMQKWRDRGVDVRIVRNRDGVYKNEDFSEAVDGSTKVVFLDSVTWINGFKFDIPEISKIAHENEAYMLTDSIQHLSQADLDTRTFGADIIAGGAQKWLSDWLGIGFLYVKKNRVAELHRPYYGYKNTEEPRGGWGTYFTETDRELFPDFNFYNNDARKFEYGGSLYNMPGLVALSATLKLINGIGTKEIQKKILKLKHHLMEGLEGLGFSVLPPQDEKNQSGITTFNMGIGAAREIKVVEKLNSSGFLLSYRAGGGLSGIRVSTHYVNNGEDVDKLLSALKDLRN